MYVNWNGTGEKPKGSDYQGVAFVRIYDILTTVSYIKKRDTGVLTVGMTIDSHLCIIISRNFICGRMN